VQSGISPLVTILRWGELDHARTRPERPFQAHTRMMPLEPGVPVKLDVEIWPSATLFESGSELIVEILGHDADRYPALRHRNTIHEGPHTIDTGASNTSSALVFTAAADG
jgi:hypothetical protein